MLQHLPQELPGEAGWHLGHILGDALGDNLAAARATARAQVDDPVGVLHHVQIVLDHDHGVARIHQPRQHAQQLINVREVQTRGRLIKNVQGATGGFLGQLARQLHPLRLAAGQGGGRLAQGHVAQAHLAQGF